MSKKAFSLAMNKVQSFCAYRDRSKEEVRQKLTEFDLSEEELKLIIDSLVVDNFINEERFVTGFVRGKFKIKKWGKHKIKAALVSKRVATELIKPALSLIDEKEYIETLKALVEKKMNEVKKKDPAEAKFKVARYAAAKGYESDLIWDVLNEK
ncbi:MAG: RecX family transcriptional regulator [Bacteroidota bacterium]|nr:RecX family transcriptional regulator [Bacteroidota bacterium]